MKLLASSLASLLVASALLTAVPVFAAGTAADAAAAAAGATPAAPAAPGADSGDQGTTDAAPAGPPAEAPVPDPFIAEVLKTCRDGASGDKATYQRLQDAGWGLSVDGDTQTPFYQAFNGEKDFDGVGTVDITYSLEVYPDLTEGYCSLSIDTAQRKVGIDDLKKLSDLKGQIKVTDEGVASTWQNASATPTEFIQVDQHKKDLYFILDVTTLTKKPAVEIPYVKPDAPDDGTDSTDSGTNASD